jgi:hypothetical protein
VSRKTETVAMIVAVAIAISVGCVLALSSKLGRTYTTEGDHPATQESIK